MFMTPNILFQFSGTIPEYEGKPVSIPDRWDTSAIGEGVILVDDTQTVLWNDATYFSLNAPDDVRLLWPYTYPFYWPDMGDAIGIQHYHSWWILGYWVETDVTPLTRDYVISIFNEDEQVSSVTVRCQDGDLSFLLQISYDPISYASIEEAWDGGSLEVWMGIRSYDTVEGHYSVWVMIGQLLTFQAPEVHPLLNIIIAVPLWVGIAISLLYVFDKIVPFG